MRQINKIIIHCSASDNPNHDNVDTITQWHWERGFSDIGYHFYIDKKGQEFKGRSLSQVGAHCEGHNFDSIGICLGGLKDFKPEQFVSLRDLVKRLMFNYGIKIIDVYPHNFYNKNKTCPNFDLEKLKESWE